MDANLYFCVACCVVVTILPKILPLTFLDGDSLPELFRKWLDFVPVAVMAALVGSEIFFYNGEFSLKPSNLYLMVSLPLFFLAWLTKNYFITIAVGMGLIICARAFGF